MGTIRIYLSIVEGKVQFRDSEKHKGRTIESIVDPGDKIIWKLDQCSGIKEISNISVHGTAGFLSKGPRRKDFDRWTGRVSMNAVGEIKYVITVLDCNDQSIPATNTLNSEQAFKAMAADTESAKIKIRG